MKDKVERKHEIPTALEMFFSRKFQTFDSFLDYARTQPYWIKIYVSIFKSRLYISNFACISYFELKLFYYHLFL